MIDPAVGTHGSDASRSAHAASWKPYLVILLVLCVLTWVTVAVAGRDFGPFNLIVALAIAGTKATLVVLYFMHLRHSEPLTRLVLFVGVVLLAILILLTLNDYVSRPWPILPPNAPPVP